MRHREICPPCPVSRRQVSALLGAVCLGGIAPGRGFADAAMSSSCVIRPEQTEGPYFVDERLHRVDIRSDPADGQVAPGAPLALTMRITDAGAGKCGPVPDARVYLWQCDAQGVYSDVQDPRFDTVGRKFLRGYQITDAAGEARFITVYPGWYPGRTVHIHFKIRTAASNGRVIDFTSQLYFDDALTDRVHASAPYAARGQGRTRNRNDGVFRRGGDQLMLNIVEKGGRYEASFDVGLQLAEA